MLGETISHYEILEKLGEGGMGVVYKARDTKLDRSVAIKFLPQHLSADKEARKRFIREAKSTSALDHQHICTIYEIDETDDGRTFIVMAFYEGETLRERIDRGGIDVAEAMNITSQIAAGLAKAHSRDIVHRDIKPQNILLTSDGEAKIIDFGLAKLLGHSRLTKTGHTIGTAAYMSPEQARGEEVDHRSDIFSLGTIFYEMVSGELPFKGEHEVGLLYGIVHEEPEPLPDEVTAANPGIQPFIDKVLAKDPTERFSDSSEMNRALEGLSGGNQTAMGYQEKSTSGFFLKPAFRWGLVVVLVVLSVFVWLKYTGQQEGQPLDPVKIAVLPFANHGLPNDDYLSDGISDAITVKLGSVQSIRVIARQSVVTYKESDKSIEEISGELGGVDYIINGTVQRERPSDPSSRVRIIPHLISVEEGTDAWSDIYDQEMGDIFVIQSDIADRIAEAIDVALPGTGEKGEERDPTKNLEAYEFYLKGNSLVDQHYYDVGKMQASAGMYEKALDIDPDYIDALVALAIQSCWLAYQHQDVDNMSVRARVSIDRAVALDPQHPGVYLARGTYNYVLYRDYESAMSDFQAAYDMNPSSLETVNSIGWVQRRMGQWEEARMTFLKAKQLDPGTISQNSVIAQHLLWMQRYDEARQYLDLMLLLDPDDQLNIYRLMELYLKVDGTTDRARELLFKVIDRTGSNDIAYYYIDYPIVQRILVFSDSLLVSRVVDEVRPGQHLMNGEMFTQIGEAELAAAHYDSLRIEIESELPDSDEVLPMYYPDYSRLSFVYARLGMKEKALEYAELAVEKLPVSRDALQGVIHLETLAMVCAITGEHDRAFDLLDQILAMPVSVQITPKILWLDPVWEPISRDPRFDRLIEKYSKGTN